MSRGAGVPISSQVEDKLFVQDLLGIVNVTDFLHEIMRGYKLVLISLLVS